MKSHPHPLLVCVVCAVIFFAGIFSPGRAQTRPPEGIRKNTPSVHAFIHARIIQSPGKTLEHATLVIRDGVITAVGDVPVPADARVWDLNGETIYAGLIDGYSDYGMPKVPSEQPGRRQQPPGPLPQRGPVYWSDAVQAQRNAADLFIPDDTLAEKLRGQGFTTTLTVPRQGNFRGSSALVDLGSGAPNDLVIRSNVAMHLSFEFDPRSDDYPSSLMGVIALIRQTLLDAGWYQRAWEAYSRNPSLPRPEVNEALAALKDVLRGTMPAVIEVADELSFLRAEKIAKEFSLTMIVRGSGREYMRLDAVKAAHRPVILPLNFPDVPAVQTPEQALQISLTDLRYWDEAPENPKQLQEAGVTLALTSATLKDPGTYLARLRTAVQRGLPQEAALAALTTTPARLFGIEKRLGTIEQGKQANFIITSGDLFSEKTVIHESWINGKRYEVKPAPDIDPRGTWRLTIAGPFPPGTTTMTIKGEPDALQGAIRRNRDIPLSTVSLDGLRLLFSFSADSLGSSGMVRMTGSFINDSLAGTGEWTDGRTVAWSASRVTPFVAPTDTSKKRPPIAASFPPDYPHGEFGRRALPDQPTSILIRGATVWTCGPGGRIDTGDVLFGKGKILGVGKNLHLPPAALVIDGKGKHVTPGLIDAHSHIAVSGNVNEAARAVSAQVRIADVLNSDDISIYRQLAGGLTEAHVLHGSANPIGGQCQLIKLRWGMLPDDLVFAGAPPTIKFALGENVKQSNWGERYTVRYPQTRMGVEQLMRDEFRAALDYEQRWKAYERNNAGLPPRRDLELEAILEVIHGKRLVHCHSYRQDELLAMMRVADDFGFHIQTFQHVLEGYKVADIMAKHGASGSTFTDWWAYKFEVYDAIPYNGVLMHDQGILVSFNSDDAELARRLNLEAAKAMKYGGLPDTEALKFVTINPARQLRVDKLVGSLEPGKDADLVIWSGNPLSSFSRCEQTWIDGRKYFDRVEDRALYEEAMHERSVLVQKALAAKKAPPGSRRPGSPGMEIEEGR